MEQNNRKSTREEAKELAEKSNKVIIKWLFIVAVSMATAFFTTCMLNR